jgi:hypothetical protein
VPRDMYMDGIEEDLSLQQKKKSKSWRRIRSGNSGSNPHRALQSYDRIIIGSANPKQG